MYFTNGASISNILDRTDFTTMSPPSSTTPDTPFLNGTVVNGLHPHHDDDAVSLDVIPAPSSTKRPTILHLGDPICYYPDVYTRLASQFDFIRPKVEDLDRETFKQHLRDGTWGNFSAIMKPFWSTGSEMHPWITDLIELLPPNMKIMAGAGAGFDWVDTKALAERGILHSLRPRSLPLYHSLR